MSLLDDLSDGKIDYDHMCMIQTKYGKEPRTESHLFAWDSDLGKVHVCICGRKFKAVKSVGDYVMWRQR